MIPLTLIGMPSSDCRNSSPRYWRPRARIPLPPSPLWPIYTSHKESLRRLLTLRFTFQVARSSITKPMSDAIAPTGAFVPPPLRQDEAHVWRTTLENLGSREQRWDHFLSPEEHQRASRFRFPRDRQRFVTGRAWLRMLLGSYLNLAPQSLSFSYTEHGKPSLNGQYAMRNLLFNISHSHQAVLFGLTIGHAIGVDVERVRYDFEVASIAKRFFSSVEQKAFFSFPSTQQHRAFFDCWTRKEAYVKAVGEGLSHPLHQFD